MRQCVCARFAVSVASLGGILVLRCCIDAGESSGCVSEALSDTAREDSVGFEMNFVVSMSPTAPISNLAPYTSFDHWCIC